MPFLNEPEEPATDNAEGLEADTLEEDVFLDYATATFRYLPGDLEVVLAKRLNR